jgi:excisionase family DNA binding protein
MTRKQTNSQPSARSRRPGRQKAAPRDSTPSDFGKLGAAIRHTRATGRAVLIALPRSPRPVPLPDPIATLLADALDAFARGHRVELAVQTAPAMVSTGAPCHYLILDRDPNDEITTQEAAVALRVSRPTIIKAIEEGRLAARKVGKHRRVRIYDFNAYAQAEHAARVAHAMDSDRIEQELGLYEIPLPPSRAAWKALLAQPQKKQSARASRRGGR